MARAADARSDGDHAELPARPTSALTPLLGDEILRQGRTGTGKRRFILRGRHDRRRITLSVWGGFKKKIVTSLTGIVMFSFCHPRHCRRACRAFWIMLVSMFLIGFMMPMVNGPIHALFQSVVEPDMQGRVLSLVSSVAQAMMPLSLLIAGPVTDATSYQTWFWVAGIFNLLIGLGGFFVPALMNIEDNHKNKSTCPRARAGSSTGGCSINQRFSLLQEVAFTVICRRSKRPAALFSEREGIVSIKTHGIIRPLDELERSRSLA
jgi:MFS family permease